MNSIENDTTMSTETRQNLPHATSADTIRYGFMRILDEKWP